MEEHRFGNPVASDYRLVEEDSVDLRRRGPGRKGRRLFIVPDGGTGLWTEWSSALFEEFSSLKTPGGCLSFARSYGLLGLEENVRPLRPGLAEAETVDGWLAEAGLMRAVLGVWEGNLRPAVLWGDGIAVVAFGRVPTTAVERELLAAVGEVDLLQPQFLKGIWVVAVPVAEETEKEKKDLLAVSKALQYVINSRQDGRSAVRVDGEGVLRWTVRPQSLLGLLWGQLALVVTGLNPFRRCGICGKPLEDLDEHPRRKVHDRCSNTQAVRRWREKRKAARG